MNRWTLLALQDRQQVWERLVDAGLTPSAADAKSALFDLTARTLAARGEEPSQEAIGCFVPGRIEVLGKHTDYAGGRSLVATVERGFCAVAVGRPDNLVRIVDAQRNEEAAFPLSPELVPQLGSWSNYPMTVGRRLAMNFDVPLRGVSMAFASDLPVAAGMSSSSALMVTTFLVLAERNELSNHPLFQQEIRTREDLAGYLGTVENGQTFGRLVGDRGVGTFGGSEDHTAILCARAGQLAQFSYCPVRYERMVDVPGENVFVIGTSGIAAEKTGAAMEEYNRASRRASAVAQIWRAATSREDPHVSAAIRSSADALDQLRQYVRDEPHAEFSAAELLDRLDQFVAESEEIIPAVPDCLDATGLSLFGRLVDRSQDLGVRLLGNQVPETIFLARSARELGALAASAFGAGFGGSVWALVPQGRAERFLNQWAQTYAAVHPGVAAQADFFVTRPGPSAIAVGPNRQLELKAAMNGKLEGNE